MNNPSETGPAFEAAKKERLNALHPYYLFQPALLGRLSKLSHKKIWISDPIKFNDPMDLRLKLEDLTHRGPFNEDQLRDAMKLLIHNNSEVALHWFYNERLLKSIQDWINGEIDISMLKCEVNMRFREFGAACFTPAWNHELMWSHYADGHAGYCIEYCVNEGILALNNPNTFSFYHVQYSSSLPELCMSEALFAPHQTLGRMLATKSAEWAYEQEWRLVHLEKKAAYVDMPAGMEISALIAGLKADSKLVQRLGKKAAALKVPAYRVKRYSGYELKMELL